MSNTQEVLEKMKVHSDAARHWATYLEGKHLEGKEASAIVAAVEDVLGCCLALQTALYKDNGDKI